jgi:Brp/Blh family beta-carotene 15,15'-monooxygenase
MNVLTTNYLASLMTLIYLVFWLLLGPWQLNIDLGIGAFLFFFLGIPHGAGDHLISESLARKTGNPFSIIQFVGKYLGVMGLYALVWYFFPQLAFVVFIGISIFHFGDIELPKNEEAPVSFIDYLRIVALGTGILGILLFSHWVEVTPILSQMTVQVPTISAKLGLGLSVLCYAGGFKRSSANLFSNTFLTLMLGIWIPLIPAFVLFFCVSHAVSSLRLMQIRLSVPFFDLYKKLLPFSVMAFLLGFVYNLLIYKSLNLSLVFVFLSLLTLPHFILMHKLQFLK